MPPPLTWTADLEAWATDRQREYLRGVIEHGSLRAAARAHGWTLSAVHKSLTALRKKAATKGWSPEHDMTRTVPDPFVVRGTSTLYDADGKPKLQWVKSKLDDERYQLALRAAVEAMAEDVPRVRQSRAPKGVRAELCNVYTLTDCHVGMLAWSPEAGADWDLKIAERTLVEAFGYLVEASPPAEVGVVAELGDFLHFDSLEAVTPTNRHVLDADGRYSKVVTVAVRTLRAVVGLALAKHKRVVVLLAEGNHDMASSVWLRHLFQLLYEREPRVTVLDSPLPYYVHQHGRTMLAWHHGHLRKAQQLPGLFAARFPREWGASTRRYCHVGHRHHVEEREHDGMIVIQHPTLAAPDAYAARGGWISDRTITAITYHAEYGQTARNTVVPEMIKAG